ncbi:uncharacterized protein HKW66_Vig0001350 [Vigna angularis]|uniref:Uncharacterized protein n=1 Tax=Phaseolus angularis TaxID=3914 RepID=A0A8T0L9I3_PHAAN|nr:uncharacterized protein HKW66_Vig0001350 [Vigna angularis]
MWVVLKAVLYDCSMNAQTSDVQVELGTRADEEGEGVVVRREGIRVKNVGVKVEAFGGSGAFRVGSDHGVESEECGVGLLGMENLVGILKKIGCVMKGYGGNKLAMEMGFVEEQKQRPSGGAKQRHYGGTIQTVFSPSMEARGEIARPSSPKGHYLLLHFSLFSRSRQPPKEGQLSSFLLIRGSSGGFCR